MKMNLSHRLGGLAAAVPALLASGWAHAQEAAPAAAEAVEAVAEAAAPTLDRGDTAWLLVATLLVLMMTLPGLALFYGGMVRKKNVLSILMQCFAIVSVLSVIWMVAGYSLAFSEGSPFVGGLSKMFLAGVNLDSLTGTIPESLFVMFQLTFAVITPALIVGGFADRMKFSSMLVFMSFWLLLVYAPICHWVWGGGFLMTEGVLDFAGGTVVHINAGVAGLVSAIVLGRRSGTGSENMAPHNLVLTMIGASLLWVGWFGFNAGSALAANGNAAMAMLTTHSATAMAAMTWMLVEWAMRGKPSLLGILSGAVAGLVAITPACGFVDLKGALIIGAVSGLACYWGVSGLKRMFGYDDALDCFGVHGVGGIVGAILTGVFAVEAIGGKTGLIEGNAAQVGLQALGVGVTMVYTAIVSYILLKIIDVAIGLRVSPEVEVEGLDYALHGETVH
ncbi:MAG: ammonium transporter [Alphaproteobacteria bacterium]|nr:ammonium transporter [Alphaproteobacteria bacterium]